jgi:hypothetical protein
LSLLREREDAARHAWLHWEPSPALGCPQGMDGVPPWGNRPLSPSMLLTWTSGGQTARLRPDPNRRSISTRNHLTVESSETEYWTLPDRALALYDHTLTLKISLGYYAAVNHDAGRFRRTGGHHVPKYLRPSVP